MSETVLYICPQCGSTAITSKTSMLVGTGQTDTFTCGTCKWKGLREQVVAVPFSHDWNTDEGLLQSLVSDLRTRLAQNIGKEFLRYLLRWGFMTTADPQILGRYLSAIARAVITAIVEERLAMEKETVHAGN